MTPIEAAAKLLDRLDRLRAQSMSEQDREIAAGQLVIGAFEEFRSRGQQFYGWFDDAAQTEPTYKPPLGSPCPFCGMPVDDESDMRTHSLMYQTNEYAKRSYFYRTHRTCAETDPTHCAKDSFILDMIAFNND